MNKTEVELPAEPRLPAIVEDEGDLYPRADDLGMKTVTLNHSGLSVMSIFTDRGMGSGHLYQANCNHRKLDFTNLTSTQKREGEPDQRALVLSFIDQQPGEKFDTTTPMSFSFCQVRNEREGLKPKPYSHNELLLDYPLEDDHELHGSEVLDTWEGFDTWTEFVSAKTMQRAFHFFNREWMADDGNNVKDLNSQVGLSDFVRFFQLFGDHDFSTPDRFRHFVETFGLLDGTYAYDDKLPLTDNIRQLGELFRSVCDLRLLVFDGQHRWCVACLFLTGNFKINNKIPLRRYGDLHDVFPGHQWKNMQVFNSLSIKIGVPAKNTSSITKALTIMRSFGQDVTTAQTHHFGYTWSTAVMEVSDSMRPNFEHIGKITFDKYWKKARNPVCSLDFNTNLAWDTIKTYFKHKSVSHPLLVGASKKLTHTDVLDAAEKRFMGYDIVCNLPGDNIDGLPGECSFVLQAMKVLCHDIDHFRMLNKTFKAQIYPKRNQRSETQEFVDEFRSMKWLSNHLFFPVAIIAKHLFHKYMVEFYIAEQLRRKPYEEAEVTALEDGIQTLDFRNVMDTEIFPAIAGKKTKYTWGELGFDKTPSINPRIRYAIFSSLLIDALNCLCHNGYDPAFTSGDDQRNDKHNSLLRMYLAKE